MPTKAKGKKTPEEIKREKQVQFFENDKEYQKDHGGKHIPMKDKKKKK